MPDSFAATACRPPAYAVAACRVISGLSRDEQRAYIDIVADLLAKPDLDAEVARAADWLLQKLKGRTFAELRLANVA
jgi:hypothetical protein